MEETLSGRLRAVVAATTLAILVLAGCGGDDKGSAPTTTESQALVPDAAVIAGLNSSIAMAKSLAAEAASAPVPAAEFQKLHDIWASYEATVRKKDVDLYLTLEDDLSAIKKSTG